MHDPGRTLGWLHGRGVGQLPLRRAALWGSAAPNIADRRAAGAAYGLEDANAGIQRLVTYSGAAPTARVPARQWPHAGEGPNRMRHDIQLWHHGGLTEVDTCAVSGCSLRDRVTRAISGGLQLPAAATQACRVTPDFIMWGSTATQSYI